MGEVSESEYRTFRDLVVDGSLVRHDLVTARAISRLSHGVARLNTSTNPAKHSSFRLKSYKDDGHSKMHQGNILFHVAAEETDANWSKDALLGSKRKWQSPGPLCTDMETDDTRCADQVHRLQKATTSTCQGYDVSSKSNTTSSGLYMMHSFDCSERHSSCSSMLSMTASDTSGSSHASEADEEDANNRDMVTTASNKVLTSSMLSVAATIAINRKRFGNVSLPKIPAYGGDSSDGFSSTVKIPRLSNVYPIGFTQDYPRRTRRPNRSNAVHRLTDSGVLRPAHDRSCVPSCESGKRVKTIKSHRHCRIHSDLRFRSLEALPSLNVGSVHGNPTGAVPVSFEELADDEQSDFPADESMPLVNQYNLTRPFALSSGQIRINKPRRLPGTNWIRRIPRTSFDDLDSDMEDFFADAWSASNHDPQRVCTDGTTDIVQYNGPSSRHASLPMNRSVIFMPSKLDPPYSDVKQTNSETPVPRKTDSGYSICPPYGCCHGTQGCTTDHL